MSEEKIEAIMTPDKVCKHSVRFKSTCQDNPSIPTIYISKPWFENAKRIKITIEECDE